MSSESRPEVPTVEGVAWVSASGGELPEGSFVGGNDDGASLYVARADHEGAVIPGKFVQGHSNAYIPWGGEEHSKQDYEVLVVDDSAVTWTPTSGNAVPPNAIPAGVSQDGETLYIGRATHEGALTVGKVHPSHGVVYVSYGGAEHAYPEFEILTKN